MTRNHPDIAGLLPCPFCGGEAERYDCDDTGSFNEGLSCIQCKRCGASSAMHGDRKENLVSGWNDRTERGRAGVSREALAAKLLGVNPDTLRWSEYGYDTQQHYLQMADVAIAACAQEAEPDKGEAWQLVPKEPTKEMIQASIWALDRWREKYGNVQGFVPPGEKYQIRWRAMLAAAPISAPCFKATQNSTESDSMVTSNCHGAETAATPAPAPAPADVGEIVRELIEDFPAVDVTTVVFSRDFAGVGCSVIPQDKLLAIADALTRLSAEATDWFRTAAKNQVRAQAAEAERDDLLKANQLLHAFLTSDRARLAEAVEIIQFAHDGYENHNVNHVDYRVRVYQACLDFLNHAYPV